MKLTPRQQEILDFIKSTLEVLGAPPTRAEISQAFGFASPNAAEDHLKALAKKGAIVLEPGSARGIRLVEQLGLEDHIDVLVTSEETGREKPGSVMFTLPLARLDRRVSEAVMVGDSRNVSSHLIGVVGLMRLNEKWSFVIPRCGQSTPEYA